MSDNIERLRNIALVAHDNKKKALLEWAKFNRDLLAHHKLFATGTTGEMLEKALKVEITKLRSGPLGGDMQLGGMMAENEIDFMIGKGSYQDDRDNANGIAEYDFMHQLHNDSE